MVAGTKDKGKEGDVPKEIKKYFQPSQKKEPGLAGLHV
jgi:hypothetical protein